MTLWPSHSLAIRPDASEKRPCLIEHFIHPDASERGSRLQNGGHRIAKRSLAWRERSEGKSVPAMVSATMCIKTRAGPAGGEMGVAGKRGAFG